MAAFNLKSVLIDNPLTIAPDRTVMDAIQLMSVAQTQKNPLSKVVLVVAKARLLGIITQGDLIQFLARQQLSTSATVGEIMISPVIILQEDDFRDAQSILDCLQQHQISQIPVVDPEGNLLGLVT